MTTVLSYDIIKSYKKTRERKKVFVKLKGGNVVFLLKLEEVQQNIDFTKVERLLEQHVFTVEEFGKTWYSFEDLCKEIEESELAVSTMNAKILEMKKLKQCPICENVVGRNDKYCSKCGEVFKEETYNKTGHQHTSKVITDATCTEDGSIKEVCDDCGTVIKVTVIAHTGHKLVNNLKNATCTQDGYIDIKCSKCGYVESHTVLRHSGHSWTDWQVVKEPT